MALTDKLTAIANSIRTHTGEADSLTLEQMADAIIALPVLNASTIKCYIGTTEPDNSMGEDGDLYLIVGED